MATKEELMADPNSCWNKAGPKEQLFVLREVDMIAPFVVRQWARMMAILNSTVRNIASDAKPDLRLSLPAHAQKKHDDAMNVARLMEEAPNRKIPD